MAAMPLPSSRSTTTDDEAQEGPEDDIAGDEAVALAGAALPVPETSVPGRGA
jgi:hypothetical protein